MEPDKKRIEIPPIMESKDPSQAYDIGLADGVMVVDSVADEYIRLQDECARLRCQLDQMTAQEWMRRVRVMESDCDEADERVRRAKSVAGFWILVAAILGAAVAAETVYIFWR